MWLSVTYNFPEVPLVGMPKNGNIYALYSHSLCCVFLPPVDQKCLKILQSELFPISYKWYSLGVQLEVPISNLKCIKVENSKMDQCLLKMLATWLKTTNPPSTWNILTGALESPPVGEKLLAQQLRDKYCSRTEVEVTHCNPSQQPVLPDAISQGSLLKVLCQQVIMSVS